MRALLLFLWLMGLSAGLQAAPGIIATDRTSGTKADSRLGQTLKGCGALSVQFALELDGGQAQNYRWLLPAASTLVSPVNNYPQGSYTVQLQVDYKGAGETSFQSRTFSIQLQVDPAPIISFEADQREVCLGGTVTFRNTSQGVTLSNATLVVDGKTYDFSSGTVAVVFNRPGVFSATMRGESGQGCVSISDRNNYITVGSPYTLSILASDQLSCQPEAQISFTAQALDASGKPLPLADMQLQWDFGDGTPLQTGGQVTHTFSRGKGDVFQVRLSGSYRGCVQQANPVSVRMLTLPTSPLSVTLPQRVCEAYQVQFSTTFGSAFNGLPLQVDYGDGSPVEQLYLPAVFSHNYVNTTSSTLSRKVKLSIPGLVGGCETTYDLQVPAIAAGRIALKVDKFCSDTYLLEASLKDAVNLGSDYYWLVGDGTPRYAGQSDITHTLKGYGKQWVKLVFAPQVAGLTPCVLDSVQVEAAKPEVRIFGPLGGCEPFDLARLSYDSRWDKQSLESAGLVESSNRWVILDTAGTVLYTASGRRFDVQLPCGRYTLKVEVTGGPESDPTACSWDTTKVIRVGKSPDLDFAPDLGPAICNGTTVRFTNLSTSSDCQAGKVRYQWDYDYRGGEGDFRDAEDSQGNGAFLYDNYPPDNEVTVALRAIADGCTTEVVKTYPDLLLLLSPRANFSLTASPCDQGVLKVSNNSLLTEGRTAVFDWLFTINGQAYQVSTNQLQEDPVKKLPPIGGRPQGEMPPQALVEVRLIVQDPLSIPSQQPPAFCIDTLSRFITMPPPYELPVVTPVADTVCVSETIPFQVSNYPAARSYTWIFTRVEDGASFETTVGGPQLNTNLPAGTFNALVRVQVDDSCRLELPFGPFLSRGASGNIVGPATRCLGEQATFRVENFFQTAPLVRWRWLLDDATLAEGSNDSIPTVTYTFSTLKADQARPYILRLELEADGCLQTLQWLVWVTRPLVRPLQNDFVTDCQGGFQRIALDISTANLLSPWQAQWHLQTDQGEQPLQPERVQGGMFDLRLPVGEHDVVLRLRDSEGCSSDTVFRIQVPDLGTLVAAFTPDRAELSCPELIVFTDSANGKPGNSQLRKGPKGEIPVIRRIWDFGDGTSTETMSEQAVTHFYRLPGIYVARMRLQDADGCEAISDSVVITINGVAGTYALGRRMGYQTLEGVRLEAFPVLQGVQPEQVSYSWASGDGRSGNSKVVRFDYEQPGVYIPSLIFSVELTNCSNSAFNKDSVTVLSCPELSLRDTVFCADQSGVRLSALPAGFVPMQYENDLFRFSSQVLFTWEVDGTPVDVAQGGADSVQSFTAGSGGPFAIDPADADGRLYRVRMWVLSDYVDKQDSAASVLGEVRCEQERSFRVRFAPLPSFVLVDSVPDDCRPGERLLQARHQAFSDSASYRWILGDGRVVQTRRPELRHTYTASGTYTVQLLAYSDEGCSYADELQVVVPVLSVARIQVPDGCMGSPLQVENSSELQGSVSYSWDFDYRGGVPRLQPRNERPLVTYERPGRYVVYMQVTEDSTGCSYTAMDTLEVFPVPQLRMPSRFPICPGETVALTPLQTSDSLRYRWSTGDTTATISVSPERRTVYTLTVTNVYGCQTIDSVVVEPLTVRLDSTRFQGCEGSLLSLRAPAPTQQGLRVFYRWPNGDTTSTWQVAAAGDYTLRMTLVDSTGKECYQELVFQASFNPLPADALPSQQYFCFKWGVPLELQAADGPYAYRWLDTQETSRRVTRSKQGLYKVELTDLQTGCQSIDSIEVTELCEGVLVTPNTFTPNSDGFNDYFVPKAEGVRQLRLLIYSRWGELVFDRSYADEEEMGRPGMGWDGTLQGRPQQQGLYSYVLFYGTPLSGKQPALYGQVLLLR